MMLDVYRGCSKQERREVLGVFWRRGTEGSDRVERAALEYGLWALACFVIVALELVPLFVGLFGRSDTLAWIAVGAEVLALTSAWWAALRYVTLRRLASV
jgi:hypothetical protein